MNDNEKFVSESLTKFYKEMEAVINEKFMIETIYIIDRSKDERIYTQRTKKRGPLGLFYQTSEINPTLIKGASFEIKKRCVEFMPPFSTCLVKKVSEIKESIKKGEEMLKELDKITPAQVDALKELHCGLKFNSKEFNKSRPVY